MYQYDLEKKIKKIIDDNCKYFEYEGTEVDKGSITREMFLLCLAIKNKEIIIDD